MKLMIDDGMQVTVGTGIGKYTIYLYDSLKRISSNDDIINLHTYERDSQSKITDRIKYLKYINSNKFLSKCKEYDVIHFTNYAMPYRRSKSTKYVVTIHDLAAFRYPDTFSKKYAAYSRFVTNYSIRNADLILTVSDTSKKEIQSRWPQYAEKIEYIYPGYCSEFSSQVVHETYKSEKLKEIAKNKFFLCVGTIEKRKNLGVVIEAFIRVKREGGAKQFKLVLAGREGFGSEEYRDIIERSTYKEDIIMTGYVEAQDLAKLYREAAAYIFPTVYEGFGLTQLECMANHLPLILSDIPTNREVSKNYGLFFSLKDLETLVKQMIFVVNNKYNYNEHNIIADKYIRDFDWDIFAKKYISEIKRVLNK